MPRRTRRSSSADAANRKRGRIRKRTGGGTHAPPSAGARLFSARRGIFVAGEISDEMLVDLTPRIIGLRDSGDRPITVYIDSNGGSVDSATRLCELLTAPDEMGRRPRLNTVVTGHAMSAAASLLTKGDYIAAYPHSKILFHGVWTPEEQVTVERAGILESELRTENRYWATEWARSIFPRLLDNHRRLRAEIRTVRTRHARELSRYQRELAARPLDVPGFVYALERKVERPQGELLRRALESADTMTSVLKRHQVSAARAGLLGPSILAALQDAKKSPADLARAQSQISLLLALIVERLRRQDTWDLSEQNVEALEQEFLSLWTLVERDGDPDSVDDLIGYARDFMTPADRAFLRRHRARDVGNRKVARAIDAIVSRSISRLEPMWLFTLALCGELSAGDHLISAQDAWWCGVIDEIIGTPWTRRTLSRSVRSRMLLQMPVSDAAQFY